MLTAGISVPDDIHVVIEIAANSPPVKYEMDKATGRLMVDRFLGTAMFYPCNYGFIPLTLSEDHDPLDVLLVSPYALLPGTVIAARPVGALLMTDESGKDTKIMAVPVDRVTLQYQGVMQSSDLGQSFIKTIEHFFTHYKDLDPGKWATLQGWETAEEAKQLILAAVERYQQH